MTSTAVQRTFSVLVICCSFCKDGMVEVTDAKATKEHKHPCSTAKHRVALVGNELIGFVTTSALYFEAVTDYPWVECVQSHNKQ